MNNELLRKISGYAVVPVIAIDSVELALPLADALIQGGLPVAEITFRTKAAADVIALLAQERPELILGAGTVLTIDNLQRARDCGATFAVAPGTNPFVIEKAQKIELPFIPGIQNPTDIESALSLGCTMLKFFPAEASGGVNYLNAISAPYLHTGIKFIPTGGVNSKNLADYLKMPSVLACGGTWIAKKEDLTLEKWDQIASRCQEIAAIVRSLK